MELPYFTPFENEFSHEIRQIKYLHKFTLIIKSQLSYSKDIIENEIKNDDILSNSSTNFIMTYINKTANFKNDSSDLFNTLNKFTLFNKEFLYIYPEEKIEISSIPKITNENYAIILNKFKLIHQKIKEMDLLLNEKKRKVEMQSKQIVEIENIKNEKIKAEEDVFNPYEITHVERIDKKLSEMINQIDELDIKEKDEIDLKLETFNKQMIDLYDTIIPLLVFKNLKVKNMFCFLCNYKLRILERLKKSAKIFHDNFANFKIFLNDQVETKFLAESKNIYYSSLEDIKNMIYRTFSDINFNPLTSTITFTSQDPSSTSISLSGQFLNIVENILNYLHNFSQFVYTRKTILKNFLNLHTQIIDLIKSNQINLDKNSNLIKSANEEVFKFIQDNLIIGDKRFPYNYSIMWEMLDNNFTTLITSIINFVSISEIKFHPLMKEINSDYKKEIYNWKELKKKYESKLVEMKNSINKYQNEKEKINTLIKKKSNSIDDLKLQNLKNEEQIKINVTRQLIYNNKEIIIECLANCIELSNLIRINESNRLENFMIVFKELSVEQIKIINDQIKIYSYLYNLANSINLNDEIKSILDPLITNFEIKENKSLYDRMNEIISQKLDEEKMIIDNLQINFIKLNTISSPKLEEINLIDFSHFDKIKEDEKNNSKILIDMKNQIKSKSPNENLKEHKYNNIFSLHQDEEYLSNFNCAYKKKILVQGKIYITTLKIVFSSWFNSETLLGGTKLIIPLTDIISIKKKKYLKIFNNAIQINTKKTNKINFVSFVNREKCFDLIQDLLDGKYKRKIIMEEENREFKNINETDKQEITSNEDEQEYESEIENEDINDNLKENKEDILKYRNEFIKWILNQSNLFHRLKNIHDQKTKELETSNPNMISDFYKIKIFEKEMVGEIPANYVYNIIFNKNFKTPELVDPNLNFFENIFNQRKDKEYEYKTLENNIISEYYFDYKSFINLLTELNMGRLNIFLNELESTDVNKNKISFEYTFTHPIKKRVFVGKEVSVRNVYSIYFISPLLIFINMKTFSKGIPYADHFHTELFYKIESKMDLKNKFNFKTYVSIYFTVVFDKPVFMKGFIEKEATKEAKEDINQITFPLFKRCVKNREESFKRDLEEIYNFNFNKITEGEEYLEFVKNRKENQSDEILETVQSTKPNEEEINPLEILENKLLLPEEETIIEEENIPEVKENLIKPSLFSRFLSYFSLKNLVNLILISFIIKSTLGQIINLEINFDKSVNIFLLILVIFLFNTSH